MYFFSYIQTEKETSSTHKEVFSIQSITIIRLVTLVQEEIDSKGKKMKFLDLEDTTLSQQSYLKMANIQFLIYRTQRFDHLAMVFALLSLLDVKVNLF